jgi:hypothetical protein
VLQRDDNCCISVQSRPPAAVLIFRSYLKFSTVW